MKSNQLRSIKDGEDCTNNPIFLKTSEIFWERTKDEVVL